MAFEFVYCIQTMAFRLYTEAPFLFGREDKEQMWLIDEKKQDTFPAYRDANN